MTLATQRRMAAIAAPRHAAAATNDGCPPYLAVYGRGDERRVLSAATAVGGGAQIPSLSERRGPASVEPRPLLLSLELDLLGNAERVVDLDAEVADRAFELRVPKQKLDRSEVARFLVDLGRLRPAHRVGAVTGRVKPN